MGSNLTNSNQFVSSGEGNIPNMSLQDIRILIAAFFAVLILVMAAALFPIYGILDGTYVRRPVWNPPSIAIGNGYDEMSAEDIQRLSAIPQQREILESMKYAPRTFQPRPVWIGSRHGPDRNPLGYMAMMSVLAFAFLLIHKWVNRG